MPLFLYTFQGVDEIPGVVTVQNKIIKQQFRLVMFKICCTALKSS